MPVTARLRFDPSFIHDIAFRSLRRAPVGDVRRFSCGSSREQQMASTSVTDSGQQELHRTIDWKGAFWVASGVPALVLFSIGGIGGIGGTAAFAIWAVSMLMGFIQSFTYAEIAGLFPNKSGGASVYGAAAWLKYGKFIAPDR